MYRNVCIQCTYMYMYTLQVCDRGNPRVLRNRVREGAGKGIDIYDKVCMSMSISVCMHVCMMYVRMHVYACLCVSVSMYVCMHVCERECIHAHACMHGKQARVYRARPGTLRATRWRTTPWTAS